MADVLPGLGIIAAVLGIVDTPAAVADDKVAWVVGTSSYVRLDTQNSSNPINRRIGIVVLLKATEGALNRSDTFTPGEDASRPMAPPTL
ncbi:MAG: hypothetical protein FJ178_03830 [Gammaproteobacteria bacterium]|nr:hypothetical protein [Gammaproteobacteria bacterium]